MIAQHNKLIAPLIAPHGAFQVVRMTDFKGHHCGEYDDNCPICFLDAEVDRLIAKNQRLEGVLAEIKSALGLDDAVERALKDAGVLGRRTP